MQQKDKHKQVINPVQTESFPANYG